MYGVEWNPYEASSGGPPAFITFGRKHIKLWTGDEGGTTYQCKQLSFGALCFAYVGPCSVVDLSYGIW